MQAGREIRVMVKPEQITRRRRGRARARHRQADRGRARVPGPDQGHGHPREPRGRLREVVLPVREMRRTPSGAGFGKGRCHRHRPFPAEAPCGARRISLASAGFATLHRAPRGRYNLLGYQPGERAIFGVVRSFARDAPLTPPKPSLANPEDCRLSAMTANDDLLNFVSSVSGDDLPQGRGEPRRRLRSPRVSEAERRQAKHDIRSVEDIVVELLRNSRDAHAQRIFVATGSEGDLRTLTVIDDGVGVPAHMHERIFEPRVTSKLETMVIDQWGVHGRGMALFSIRSNAVEARVAASELHKGASLVIVTDSGALAERADQSTWPVVERDEAGALQGRTRPAQHRPPRRRVRRRAPRASRSTSARRPRSSPRCHASARSELDASELLFCDDLEPAARLAAPRGCGRRRRARRHRRVARARDLGAHGAPHPRRGARAARAGASACHRQRPGRARAGQCRTSTATGEGSRSTTPTSPSSAASSKRRSTRSPSATTCTCKCEPKITVGRDDIRVRFEVEKED